MLSDDYYKRVDADICGIYVKRYYEMREAENHNDAIASTFNKGFLEAMELCMNVYTQNANINVLKHLVVGMYEEKRNGD